MKVLVAVLAFLACCGSVRADYSDSVLEVRFFGQICSQNRCQIGQIQGSCVAVGEVDNGPVLATVWHGAKVVWPNPSVDATTNGVPTRQGHLCQVFLNGQRYEARLLTWNEPADVALIVASFPANAVPLVELDERPETTTAEMIGFPGGQFKRVRSRITRRFFDSRRRCDELTFGNGTQAGQSGGGVFTGKGLAGIVHTTINSECYSTPGDFIAGMCRHCRVRVKCRIRGSVVPAPVPPPPIETAPPVPQQPQEREPGPAGPQGAPGPAGPKGDTGEQGPAGKDADQSLILSLTKRIAILESRGMTVQLIDDMGNTVEERTYAPGNPIKLQFNPVK